MGWDGLGIIMLPRRSLRQGDRGCDFGDAEAPYW